jgi:hypothetical protein
LIPDKAESFWVKVCGLMYVREFDVEYIYSEGEVLIFDELKIEAGFQPFRNVQRESIREHHIHPRSFSYIWKNHIWTSQICRISRVCSLTKVVSVSSHGLYPMPYYSRECIDSGADLSR